MKLVWELTLFAHRASLSFLAIIASRFRSKTPRVIETIPGDQNLDQAKKIAVYAHYDSAGQVHGYVITQLTALSDAGFCVVFVTNSQELDEESIALLKPYVGRILCRQNIGYDFGAYRDAILSIEQRHSLDALLIANDSVYGPFKPLDALLTSSEENDIDVLAMTDSWEIRYHLQSYFMLFNKAALAKAEFWQFWSDLRYINNKDAVVRQCEVGLTRLLLRLRLRCEALFPYEVASRLMYEELSDIDVNSDSFDSLTKRQQDYYETLIQSLTAGTPLNGTHFLWEKLVLDMGCPFVKRELLAVNPMKVPNLIRFEASLKSVSDYDYGLIREHLKIVTRMRSL